MVTSNRLFLGALVLLGAIGCQSTVPEPTREGTKRVELGLEATEAERALEEDYRKLAENGDTLTDCDMLEVGSPDRQRCVLFQVMISQVNERQIKAALERATTEEKETFGKDVGRPTAAGVGYVLWGSMMYSMLTEEERAEAIEPPP